MSILENIHCHRDLEQLDAKQRQELCQQTREFLIQHVSRTGGHVASNLGVVELTVALETVFDTASDRLVFDVGHQSYVHKLLTGRQDDFAQLRQFGGISGFPKPSESCCDAFVAGHASSAVSIALGMARARTLQKENYHIVALMGDGAATGGMAYEGLNDAAVSGEPMVVVLNDNQLSIDRNVGGLASHLRLLRTKDRYLGMKQKYRHFLLKIPGGKFLYKATRNVKDWLRRMLIPSTIFENMGFTYLGPVDGHDTEHLISLLRTAKDMSRPVLLHVMTQKGKGYGPSEEHPKLFHGIGKFDPVTGEPDAKSGDSFSASFGREMMALAEEEPRLCAITAAMPGGTGLLDFASTYHERIFDVGIAEEHAVSMAGGLAKQGMIPVFAVYSTFLQRAYDMILQDICMQKLHAVLAVDRAGLVGEDGETHHGIYDVGFLRHAPGLTVLAPASLAEQREMLRWAVLHQDGPVAIRYPRGGERSGCASAWPLCWKPGQEGVMTCHQMGDDVTLITFGTLLENVLKAAQLLESKGLSVGVVRLLTLSDLPIDTLVSQLPENAPVVIVEEVAANCGVHDALAASICLKRPGSQVYGINLGHRYVTHGNVDTLYDHYGLSAEKIADRVQEVLRLEN